MNDPRLAQIEQRQKQLAAQVVREGRKRLNDVEDAEFRELIAQRKLIESAGNLFNGRGGRAAAGPSYAQINRRSYVHDLIATVHPAMDPHGEARQALGALQMEKRITGVGTTVGSSTGFVVPQFDLDQWAWRARAASALYSLLPKEELNSNTVDTPKISVGNTAAAQSADFATVNNSTWTELPYISVSATTYSGSTYVSEQALRLSPVKIDDLVMSDLVAATYQSVDVALIASYMAAVTASGTTINITAPNSAQTIQAVAQGLNVIATTRFNTTGVVGVTHPAVINGLLSESDMNGRPIWNNDPGTSFNPGGAYSGPGSLGNDGGLNPFGSPTVPAITLLGVPIYADANITITNGRAPILLFRPEDDFVSEQGLQTFVSPHVAASQLAWFLRTDLIMAGPTIRYPEALVSLTGYASVVGGS